MFMVQCEFLGDTFALAQRQAMRLGLDGGAEKRSQSSSCPGGRSNKKKINTIYIHIASIR